MLPLPCMGGIRTEPGKLHDQRSIQFYSAKRLQSRCWIPLGRCTKRHPPRGAQSNAAKRSSLFWITTSTSYTYTWMGTSHSHHSQKHQGRISCCTGFDCEPSLKSGSLHATPPSTIHLTARSLRELTDTSPTVQSHTILGFHCLTLGRFHFVTVILGTSSYGLG